MKIYLFKCFVFFLMQSLNMSEITIGGNYCTKSQSMQSFFKVLLHINADYIYNCTFSTLLLECESKITAEMYLK